MLIEQILTLRERGYSFRKIAIELNTTVGKVQYRYQKYRQQQEENEEIEQMDMIPSVPSSYERDEFSLLPQSPTTVYAFWEVSASLRQVSEHQTRHRWEELSKCLRVYDCTMIDFNGHNSHRYFDIYIPEMTNNWVIRELEPNRTYIVDFGVQTRQGSFLSLLRSNAIDTPRSSDSINGLHVEAVNQWKSGKCNEPNWLEHFSTYSYYEKIK
ncbi:DUF4912 domain-containing protein [Alkalihalobacillus sp. MEB130]|uniref:DUF4912 domain-containing protein n=1 Tax=Alkalihalobacillus sp. MEB130 TaxID=2976704 RepID=UPI0028E08D79|nr:DUF4912 domain-containing protein [Alkalihalobacillus sp. MEB130]MDT8861736.1 DUF4912 domain-containing protein [Alkalihalobacillus sp. MEB130]